MKTSSAMRKGGTSFTGTRFSHILHLDKKPFSDHTLTQKSLIILNKKLAKERTRVVADRTLMAWTLVVSIVLIG
jgi:uncharacterized membrane protein YidH (DUF202 family)